MNHHTTPCHKNDVHGLGGPLSLSLSPSKGERVPKAGEGLVRGRNARRNSLQFSPDATSSNSLPPPPRGLPPGNSSPPSHKPIPVGCPSRPLWPDHPKVTGAGSSSMPGPSSSSRASPASSTPPKSTPCPVLKGDKPWDSVPAAITGPYVYGTVAWDGGKLRLWYQVLTKGNHVGYAESRDGIHWTKPDLGIIEFNGSKANNFCLSAAQPEVGGGECHNPSVLRCPEPADPAKALRPVRLRRQSRPRPRRLLARRPALEVCPRDGEEGPLHLLRRRQLLLRPLPAALHRHLEDAQPPRPRRRGRLVPGRPGLDEALRRPALRRRRPGPRRHADLRHARVPLPGPLRRPALDVLRALLQVRRLLRQEAPRSAGGFAPHDGGPTRLELGPHQLDPRAGPASSSSRAAPRASGTAA